MALKENDLRWFKPLWRRVAVAVFLALWLAWELLFTRDQFWALLVGAALAYVAWNFFYAFPKDQASSGQSSVPTSTGNSTGDQTPSDKP